MIPIVVTVSRKGEYIVVAIKQMGILNALLEELAATGGRGAVVAVGRGGRERWEEHSESLGSGRAQM